MARQARLQSEGSGHDRWKSRTFDTTNVLDFGVHAGKHGEKLGFLEFVCGLGC